MQWKDLEKMTERKPIKQLIKNWKADYLRA